MRRFFMFALFAFLNAHNLFADQLAEYADSVNQATGGMTLFEVIESGGLVMIFLGLLSVVLFGLIAFMFHRLDINKLLPPGELAESLRVLKTNKLDQWSQSNSISHSIPTVLMKDVLSKEKEGVLLMRESAELSARKQVSSLWGLLGYITDIAQVAPMLGLLGTVIGMIQAFNTIAFQSAVVKPVLLAGGVSKAMVTTAAGMVIAIIAMVFYSVFRSRVESITNSIEVYANDVLAALPVNDSFSRHRLK